MIQQKYVLQKIDKKKENQKIEFSKKFKKN